MGVGCTQAFEQVGGWGVVGGGWGLMDMSVASGW